MHMHDHVSIVFHELFGKSSHKCRILEGSGSIVGPLDGHDEPIYSPNSDNSIIKKKKKKRQ